ncbi:GNAT family N-acetyltransferase [Larkinella harenae]
MLTVNFTPFPTLETARLTLRELTVADQHDLFALRSNPTLMRFIARPLAKTVADAALLIENFESASRQNERITWGIAMKTSPQIIGTIGFVKILKEDERAEVGYLLHPDHHGTGLMQEALQVVIDYGFQTMKLHSIEAVIAPENAASARLLERNGFRKEGHFRENICFEGRFLDSVYYARLVPSNL